VQASEKRREREREREGRGERRGARAYPSSSAFVVLVKKLLAARLIHCVLLKAGQRRLALL
jgi:hypothetical protein